MLYTYLSASEAETRQLRGTVMSANGFPDALSGNTVDSLSTDSEDEKFFRSFARPTHHRSSNTRVHINRRGSIEIGGKEALRRPNVVKDYAIATERHVDYVQSPPQVFVDSGDATPTTPE